MDIVKLITKGANKSKTVFSVVEYSNGSFGVYKLCSNYDVNVSGGIRKTWRYVKQNITLDEAMSLYKKRLNGTQK